MENCKKRLNEVTVYELGNSLPGALCGSHLGALGMRVTAFRNGDDTPRRWGWEWSKAIRHGEPPADQVDADIVIDGRALGDAQVSGRAVTCRILGDWDVSIQEMPELIVQATVGLTGYVGRQVEPPLRIGTPVVTMATGIAAVQASLAGLWWHWRYQTPCVATVTAVGVGMALAGNNVTSESDFDARTGFAAQPWAEPRRGFRCADGVIDFIFHRDDDGFADFCQWLGRPELVGDTRFASHAARHDHEDDLVRELEPQLGQCSMESVLDALAGCGAIYAQRFKVGELVSHPQVRALGLLRSMSGADGKNIVVQVPFTLDGLRPTASNVIKVESVE